MCMNGGGRGSREARYLVGKHHWRVGLGGADQRYYLVHQGQRGARCFVCVCVCVQVCVIYDMMYIMREMCENNMLRIFATISCTRGGGALAVLCVLCACVG